MLNLVNSKAAVQLQPNRSGSLSVNPLLFSRIIGLVLASSEVELVQKLVNM